MKPIKWLGNSIEAIRSFSPQARQEAGYQLDRVQQGKEPKDWKPMREIGLGVNEIRIHLENEYRVIYVAKFANVVYVLHAFVKKTQRTSKKDIALAAKYYRAIAHSRTEK